MIYGEAPGSGNVAPAPKAAGPVIDRVWSRPPRSDAPAPSRPVPTGSRQWPTRPLGTTLGALSGWLPFVSMSALWVGAVVYGARRAGAHSRRGLRGRRRRSTPDRLRDQDKPTVIGYELDRETLTPVRRTIDTSAPGDYGADPIGDGMFRMVPSGDIVDFEERNRRLKKPALRGSRWLRSQSQTYVEGKWTPFRAGESMTTMIVETPDGNWQAKVHKDGSWSVRGPNPDDESHYGGGEVTADTERELVTRAKKEARAFLKTRIG